MSIGRGTSIPRRKDQIDLPAPTDAWQPAIRQRAHNTRAVLRRHHWAVALMASRATAHAISAVDSYVHGFVLQEVNPPFRDESELTAMTGAIMEEFPRGDFPYLFELTIEHVLQPGHNYGAEFDVGLEVVLDGVSARLDPPRS